MPPKMQRKANADKKAAEKELENKDQSSDTEEFLEEDTDAKLGKLIKNFSIAFSELANNTSCLRYLTTGNNISCQCLDSDLVKTLCFGT